MAKAQKIDEIDHAIREAEQERAAFKIDTVDEAEVGLARRGELATKIELLQDLKAEHIKAAKVEAVAELRRLRLRQLRAASKEARGLSELHGTLSAQADKLIVQLVEVLSDRDAVLEKISRFAQQPKTFSTTEDRAELQRAARGDNQRCALSEHQFYPLWVGAMPSQAPRHIRDRLHGIVAGSHNPDAPKRALQLPRSMAMLANELERQAGEPLALEFSDPGEVIRLAEEAAEKRMAATKQSAIDANPMRNQSVDLRAEPTHTLREDKTGNLIRTKIPDTVAETKQEQRP